MTDQLVRLGVIGCGVVSHAYILPHIHHGDVRDLLRVTAVCDVDGQRAEETARRWKIPAWYETHERMLESEQLDGVLVASPIPFHYEQSLAVLQSGHHVYVQKTIAETSSQAHELVEVAEGGDRVLVASPGQMLHPGYRRLREAIRDGVLGKVYWAFGSTAAAGHEHSLARQEGGVSPSPAWFYRKGGGPMADMGVYALHTLTGVLGPALAVTCLSGRGLATRRWRGRTFPVETDDNTLLLLEFGDRTLGICGAHYCYPGLTVGWGFLGLYGSEGSLELLPEEGTSYPGSIATQPDELAIDVPTGGASMPELSESHTALRGYHVWADIRHFVDRIRSEQVPLADPRQAVHVVEIMEKGRLAAATGQTQSLETTFALG